MIADDLRVPKLSLLLRPNSPKADSQDTAQFKPIDAVLTDGRFQGRPKIIAMTRIGVESGSSGFLDR